MTALQLHSVISCLKAAGRFLMRHWLIPAFLIAVVLLAMTTNVLERMFVYYPTKQLVENPSALGLKYQDVYPLTEDGIRLHGWFVPQPGAPYTFLILHGNGGNISHRLGWIQILRDLNAHILIVDYRGYGRSEGKPFEKGLYRDALAAYRWLSMERSSDKSRFILLGESLGGAVAVELAGRVPVDGLVLQSTFTSAWDMAKTIMPVGLLQPFTGVRFDSASIIPAVQCPKLFVHGNQDDIVPFRLGRKLFELAPPPKEFYEVSGAGHNDLLVIAGSEYLRRMRSFLDSIAPNP
jgi:fermentation-respiration switch protein FrsA (DUF1100 family)